MIISLKKIIFFLLLLVHSTAVIAQITVTGTVTDAENGETVPGVGVTAGKITTVTNDRGEYSLIIPSANTDQTLVFSSIGYMPKEVKLLQGSSVTVNVELKQDNKLLREVVVNGQPYDFGVKSPQMGAIAISQAQIKSLPVIFGEPDLLKTLQTTPGVQSGRSGNAGIMVRGGYFDQNSLMIDGASLYSTEHMRGFVSAVNPDIVSTLAFYRGSFPSKYSGRLSGIIDITAKEGDFYSYHGEASVGTAMGRVTVSGPIAKGKTSFAVAARMSYFGLIYQKIVQRHYDKINQKCPYSNMEFWDVNAKVVHKFSERDRLSLTFVKDYDRQDIPDRRSVKESIIQPYYELDYGGFPSAEPPMNAELVGEYSEIKNTRPTGDKMHWGNTMGALNWHHRWNDSEKNLNVTLAFTEYDYNRSQTGLSFAEKKVKFDSSARKDSVISSYNDKSTVESFSNVKNLRLSAAMNHPLGNHNTLVYGADLRQGWYRPGRHVTTKGEDYTNWCIILRETGQVLVDHRDELKIIDTDTSSINRQRLTSLNFFVGDEIRFNRFRANAGVNLSLYKTAHKAYFYPEPRLALSYLVAANTSVKASAMQVSQAERILSSVSLVAPNDIWVPATDSVPPMRSTQFGLSVNHQFAHGIDLSVEGYYKTTKGNIDYLEGTDFNRISSSWERQITIGKSRSYGVEVLLQKFSGPLTGWISYTWSRSFDKYDAPGKAICNGQEIPSLADRPHNLSVNLSQRVGGITGYPRNHFDFSLLFKYMSGRRVTLPDHVAYAGMPLIADHYYKTFTGEKFDPHLFTGTAQEGSVILPSEAFDLYMRFSGYSERYNYKLPYEMTLDLNIAFTMCHRFGESKISVGVTNVLNRKNVSNVYMGTYADGKKVVVGVCDFPITPSLSYTYLF